MAYQATVIPIMIASPSDVTIERDTIRQVIHNWNFINSQKTKVVLMPVGWDTHSAPEQGARPQEIINNKLLKECDLLIGVFWNRVGSATGDYASGTIEEIEEHLKANKLVMLYISNKPTPAGISVEQRDEVLKIKEKYRETGIVYTFSDENDFKEQLKDHLQINLNSNASIQKIIDHGTKTQENRNTLEQQKDAGLSDDSKTLLKVASSDTNGTLLVLSIRGIKLIKAGKESYGGDDPREGARWEHALGELRRNNLIVAVGHKGEVFKLTHQGWQLVDKWKTLENG